MNYIFFDINDKDSHMAFLLRYRYNIFIPNWRRGLTLMKIAICDDDKNELLRILSALADYQLQRNIDFTYKPFDNSTELASDLLRERYDIYLLDIVMPGLNGIELAREIRDHDKAADIIFLTSSPEFAVESYTVKASDYLVKPILTDRLFAALDDIMRSRNEDHDSCLVLKSTVGIHKIRISEIIYVEAMSRKVIYNLKNNDAVICVEKFASVCDQLLQHKEFILAHRSFLVNMNHIRTIGTTDLYLANGRRIPLAQRRISEIKKLYLAFQMEELA